MITQAEQHENDIEEAARLLTDLFEEQDYNMRHAAAFEVVEALIKAARS